MKPSITMKTFNMRIFLTKYFQHKNSPIYGNFMSQAITCILHCWHVLGPGGCVASREAVPVHQLAQSGCAKHCYWTHRPSGASGKVAEELWRWPHHCALQVCIMFVCNK